MTYQQQYYNIIKRLINEPNKIGKSRIGDINSRFCEQIRIDLSKEFPLQDIKKIKPSNIIHELLWMIRGDTNIKYLVENDCNIWTDDAYRYYKEKYSPISRINKNIGIDPNQLNFNFNSDTEITKEEFIKRTLNEDTLFDQYKISFLDSTYIYGSLDRVYGKQWRNFNGITDQLQNSINMLKTNPDDRRMIVVAHNPTDIEEGNVGLPSCHNYFQFYTTLNEDRSRKLSVFCNIRSNDWFLGQPYNAAQYGLLTHIIANIVNMEVGELVINSVDAHLYHSHFDGANEWLNRFNKIMDDNYVGEQGLDNDYYELFGCKAKLNIKRKLTNLDDITFEDFEFTNYNPQKFIKAPLLT